MARMIEIYKKWSIGSLSPTAWVLVVCAIFTSVLAGLAQASFGSLASYLFLGSGVFAFLLLYALHSPFSFFCGLVAYVPVNVYLLKFSDFSLGPYSLVGGIKDLLLYLVVAGVFGKIWLSRSNPVVQDTLSRLILIFIFWAALRTLHGQGILFGLVALRIVVQFILAFLVVKLTVRSPLQGSWLLKAFLLGGTFAIGIGITQLSGLSWGSLGSAYTGRLPGIFGRGNAVNMHGLYLGLLILVGVPFIVEESRFSFRLVVIIAIEACAFFLLLLTFSRRAWIAVVLGILVWSSVQLKTKHFVRLTLAAMLVLGGLLLLLQARPDAEVLAAVVDRLSFLLADEDPFQQAGAAYRIEESRRLLDIATSSPITFLFGQGLGTIGSARKAVLGYGTIHNSYASILVEMGIIGLCVFIGIMLLAVLRGLRVAVSDSPWASLAGASVACVVAILVSSLFGDMIGNFPFNFSLWMFVGLIAVASSTTLDKPNVKIG